MVLAVAGERALLASHTGGHRFESRTAHSTQFHSAHQLPYPESPKAHVPGVLHTLEVPTELSPEDTDPCPVFRFRLKFTETTIRSF